jgi:hypothetical protein
MTHTPPLNEGADARSDSCRGEVTLDRDVRQSDRAGWGREGRRLRAFPGNGLRMGREKRGSETSAKAGGVVVNKAELGPGRLRRPECGSEESRQRGSL